MLEPILTGVLLAVAGGGGWVTTAGAVLFVAHGVVLVAGVSGLVAVLVWRTVREDERAAAEAERAARHHDWAVRRLRLECRRLHRAVDSAALESPACVTAAAG